MTTRDRIIENIVAERERQVALAHGGDTEAFDKCNSRNDWIGYMIAYAGDKCHRNLRESQQFETNLIKVGALVLAALEAQEKGYC